MPEGAILLNCARGGIVDEAALLESLNAGHIYGAGLDAMQYEPPTLSAYGDTLLSHPRVIMTPHVGASTEESQARCGIAAVDIVIALLNGDVANIPQSLV
jgi:D-3-phosphoglycerate dehydrogenase